MAYTVQQLISNAFYKSQIVSRDFETVSGPQQAVGLSCLNKVLSDTAYNTTSIPYYQNYHLNTTVGQGEYFIPGLVDVDTCVFFIQNPPENNSVRFHMTRVERREYRGSSRAENVLSLPYTYNVEKQFDVATAQSGVLLSVYFKPNESYPLEIWGKFELASVVFNQDLSLTLDLFYIDYMEYLLTRRLCYEYSFDVPPGVEKEILRIEQLLKANVGVLDLTAQKISVLTNPLGADIYLVANLSKGWSTG